MEDIEAIAVLQDPVRRRLYEYVAAQDHEVSRNEAAEGAGIQRTLAAFHLDKLVDAGLLETGSRRLSGRSGPGAGRPAKLYRRARAERQFSVPARDYRTAADLLAEVAEAARLDTELQAAARREGRAARAAAGPAGDLAGAKALLAARGYEPRTEGDVLRLVNCPFHVLSERHPALVCGMNLALLEGLIEGTEGLRARMDPRPGLCCVVVERSKNNER
ncbi:metalloregulator ArsR/SmtB family transcription factor [Kibdelosporangium persicum]|uniref:Transcriptional regulator n=1 Tax=Kibdelosporangium persicum TaxID=2698649 RepID=A0ABX2FHA4_9PSEU|nr:helix-turn-helix domain-containing protein [Kibdelosporangium persicum]NRN70776.1 Transcriptional regulator [Kibdelosporangium persicum]